MLTILKTWLALAPPQVPNARGEWPAKFGGRMYHEGPPGPLSSGLWDQFKADCPGCPLWPDAEPADADRAALIAETFAFAPGWVASTAVQQHPYGTWAARPNRQPLQVSVLGYAA